VSASIAAWPWMISWKKAHTPEYANVTFSRILHLKIVMENNLPNGRSEPTWLPQALLLMEPAQLAEIHELHSGDLCPRCRAATLDYDGLLNLACPACGFALSGCFT
jgi:hypothetical protein